MSTKSKVLWAEKRPSKVEKGNPTPASPKGSGAGKRSSKLARPKKTQSKIGSKLKSTKPMVKKVKLGITASGEHGAFWVNGMSQNGLYLSMLMQRLPNIEAFVVVPDNMEVPAGAIYGLRVLSASQALADLDILIEMGLRLAPEDLEAFRSKGGKLISYVAGNQMIMNFEALASKGTSGEEPKGIDYDAVWITPQHLKTNGAYCSLLRSSHVQEVPHIWHPICLLKGIEEHGNGDFYWKNRRRDDEWRVGVFDPTVNVVKTFHLPLLVCEEAERADPALISRVLLFNTERFKGNPHFEELISALDLGRSKKVFAEARQPLPNMLGRYVDAVVTHQWENDLNYLYWDVLYSGRPLIHNSSQFSEAGYYFPDFDPQIGGEVLREALAVHGERRASDREIELETIWQFHVDNPKVQANYTALIAQVMEQE